MKRSKMIQHIQDLVYMSNPDDLCLTYKEADLILSGLERQGMAPPSTRNPLIPEDMDPLQFSTEKALDRLHSRRNPLPEDYWINEWDEEDDEYCGAI